MRVRLRLFATLIALSVLTIAIAAAIGVDHTNYLRMDQGRLAYAEDGVGNRVPDFSHAGYMGGGVAIPDAPVRVVVPPADGDDGARIQAAIDFVAGLPPGDDGLRGAVLLERGAYEIAGNLTITASGVVLRGSGDGEDGTVLCATGNDRRTVLRIFGGKDRRAPENRRRNIADLYVPVGASRLTLDSTDGLAVGNRVVVTHPSTLEWLEAMGMEDTKLKGHLKWRPGFYDVEWDRTIAAIDGNTIALDAPLTMALDATLAVSTVTPYEWPGRISRIGVENLRCVSESYSPNPMDEEHAWMAITMEAVENAWVSRVTAERFVSSLVCIWETARAITVEDCRSLAPVSEIAGYRRHAFYSAGQQTLFLRCASEFGRHDFGAGWLAAGPSAFVDCDTTQSLGMSGPIESWATGILYDGCDIDGAALALCNRERDDNGVGWAAGNCMLWNCTASIIGNYGPPTGDHNWAYGCWGLFYGLGNYGEQNSFIPPDSLYEQQLRERLGDEALAALRPRKIPADAAGAPGVETVAAERIAALTNPPAPPSHPLKVVNGWLTIDGKVVTGRKGGVQWWRGHAMPNMGPRDNTGEGVTRFVPGRVGERFTDDLAELTDSMAARGQVALEHNMGLWYDRRQDDHQMARRPDGDVWPPFYEAPWARSGEGTNWLGISKYDLTKFNPWYFGRLRRFADHCERKGLLLLNQHYFQHNILEAGAHWANYAWRTANNINNTGFPEPPDYENRKRVFMADRFYDVTNPVRRPLHEAFIRHQLETFADGGNVVHLIGAEYTGPLHFSRFWLDTIAAWEKETDNDLIVGVSFTKDVQDAILDDPKRAPTVDVIDMEQWWYTSDGGLYDPKGGENLAPRQHSRAWRGSKGRSDERTFRQIRDYRRKYPDKAIIGEFGRVDPWLVIVAGGSMAAGPMPDDDRVLAAVTRMLPYEPENALGEGVLALADPGNDYLLYARGGGPIAIDLTGAGGTFTAQWIDPSSGATYTPETPVAGGGPIALDPPRGSMRLVWLTKKM
jgi:hypothetical protein